MVLTLLVLAACHGVPTNPITGDTADTGEADGAAPGDSDSAGGSAGDSDPQPDTGDSAQDTGLDTGTEPGVDLDGDGHDGVESGGDDCDDTDPDIHPDAADGCGGVDWDCDGEEPDCEAGQLGVGEAAAIVAFSRMTNLGNSMQLVDADGDGDADLIDGDYTLLAGSRYEYLVASVDLPLYGAIDDSDASMVQSAEELYHTPAVTAGALGVTGATDLVFGSAFSDALAFFDGAAFLSGASSEPAATIVGGASGHDGLGWDVTTGDANGDGQPDLYVTGGNYAAILAGPFDSSSTYADTMQMQFIGPEYEATVGATVVAGDQDGDGVDDLFVTGYDLTHSDSEVYLIDGSRRGELVSGDEDLRIHADATDGFVASAGSALAVGDTNADGYTDLAVAAYGGGDEAHSAPGIVFVLLGPLTDTESFRGSDAFLVGDPGGRDYGYALALGDVDGDGDDDALVCAGPAGDVRGSADLLHAPFSGTVSFDATRGDVDFLGEAADDHAGVAVALGDADGDGLADIAIGALFSDRAGTDSGAVYLFYSGVGY